MGFCVFLGKMPRQTASSSILRFAEALGVYDRRRIERGNLLKQDWQLLFSPRAFSAFLLPIRLTWVVDGCLKRGEVSVFALVFYCLFLSSIMAAAIAMTMTTPTPIIAYTIGMVSTVTICSPLAVAVGAGTVTSMPVSAVEP
jgi:hypothetical protein